MRTNFYFYFLPRRKAYTKLLVININIKNEKSAFVLLLVSRQAATATNENTLRRAV